MSLVRVASFVRAASLVRAALGQPIVYFVLVGIAVFVVDAQLRSAERAVSVTPAVRDEVAAQLTQALNRSPTSAELRTGIEAWLDTELLFREALALDLDDNDAVVRAHLARKLERIVRERTVVPEPTESELKARLEANPQRYQAPYRFDVLHVFLRKLPADDRHEARVATVLAELRQGASPAGLGDHFPRGPRFERLTQLQLEQALNAKLADSLHRAALRQWQSVASPRGTHLIRVEAIHGGEAQVDSARPALMADIEEDKKQAALREYTRSLREKYRVERVAH